MSIASKVITKNDLEAEISYILKNHNIDLCDKNTWPYENKGQRQIGSSSILVTYPPKRTLPPIKSWKQVFDSNSITPPQITIYCHIPYCTGKCRFCGFKTINGDDFAHDDYINLLLTEINLVSQVIDLKNTEVVSLYFGGGTPTVFCDDMLEKLLTGVSSHFNMASNAEITVEASPETITATKARLLRKLGVTRISLGVQTFEDDILHHMNRRHDTEQTICTINNLRKAGHENINIDLIKAYPKMNLSTVISDIEMAVNLGIESITTYELVVRNDSVLGSDYYSAHEDFLSPPEQIRQSLAYDTLLRLYNYEVGPAGWYVRTKSAVYQQQYHKWQDNIPLLAFGNSGYGFYNNNQYYNSDSINEYAQLIQERKPPISRNWALNAKELLYRSFVFGCKTGFKPRKSPTANRSDWNYLMQKVGDLTNKGLLENKGGKIAMTNIGRVFSEQVAHEFYSTEVMKAEESSNWLTKDIAGK